MIYKPLLRGIIGQKREFALDSVKLTLSGICPDCTRHCDPERNRFFQTGNIGEVSK